MRTLRSNAPRFTVLLFGAIGASAVGAYIPGWAGALVGFGTGMLLLWRSGVLDSYVMDENLGMMLVISMNRFGQWTPEYKYRPHVLAPGLAVECLTAAAERVRDDWDVPKP